MTTVVPAIARHPTIQLYAQSLGQQERSKHRFWIGLRVEALLDSYWQTRPADAVKEMIVADWLDALENFTPAEITAACREYLSGADRARKPKQGDICEIMLRARKQAVAAAPKTQEPERERVSADRAAEIMAEIYGDATAPEELTAKVAEKLTQKGQ